MKDMIIEAGRNLRTLNINYEKADGTRGWREIEPYSFREKNSKEFLFAFDLEKEAIRSFYLENILEINISDRTFEPRYEVEF